MNGYSKIKVINSHKSRSIDFSDVPSLPQYSESSQNNDSEPTFKAQESNQIKDTDSKNANNQEFLAKEGDENGNDGERSDVVLSRSSSVSSTSGFQSAVKRAFSMRRSSSVSERYCRIYDQSVTLPSPLDDVGEENEGGTGDTKRAVERSVKTKRRGGRILRACKRLFGL